MDPLTNPAIVLLSAVLPLLIAVIKQTNWSPQVNAMIAFAAYIIVGVIGTFIAGVTLTPETALEFIASVSLIGTVAYNLVWSNLGKTNAEGSESIEERIMAATSPG